MTAAERAKQFTDSLTESKRRELQGDWLKHVEEINGVEPKEPTTFVWPCEKRRAHAPHTVTEPGDGELVENRDCPGVKAHPSTQIGGNYDAW